MMKVKHDQRTTWHMACDEGGRTGDGNEGLKHGGDECGGEGEANNET